MLQQLAMSQDFICSVVCLSIGEHQYEILDYVAAKFHEELGVFKLLVSWIESLKKSKLVKYYSATA